MTTKTTYKVGDKVRILNKDAIYAGDYLVNGKVYKVTMQTDSDGDIRIDDGDVTPLLITSEEIQYIEKVEESDAKMTQFKVGDVVKANEKSNGKYSITTQSNGFTGKIVEIRKDGRLDVHTLTRNDSERDMLFTGLEPKYFELVSPKPTEKQRLTMLEQKVEAMQAEIDALKAAQKAPKIKVADAVKPTPNEQRKAIIDEAKSFVEDAKDATGNCSGRKGYYHDLWCIHDAKFVVNVEKRTVVCLLKPQMGGMEPATKGIAKCAPDDVFNADIGKAIALGRALGLDVSKFEKAVQPSEVAVGQIHAILWEESKKPTGEVIAVGSVSNSSFKYVDGGWASHYRILVDTEAQY